MKKYLSLALSLALALSLTACGGTQDPAPEAENETGTETETTTITVAASTTPHAEILEVCKPILAEQGITLEINEYTDYVFPTAVLGNT